MDRNQKGLVSAVALSAVAVETTIGGARNCYDKFSCVGDTIIANDSVYGYGYKSLGEANVEIYHDRSKINEDSSNDLLCGGSFSCNKISNVTIYDDDFKCYADNSCSNATGTLFATDAASCWGTNSCSNSKLEAMNYVSCYGSQSCVNSLITNNYNRSTYNNYYNDTYWSYDTIIEGYGFLSLYQSLIYMSFGDLQSWYTELNESIVTIQLRGHLAGYNTTIICNDTKQKCNIECSGTGCTNTYYTCINGATCNVNYCDDSLNIICPIQINLTNEEIEQLFIKNKNNEYLNYSFNITELMGINYIDITETALILDNHCNLSHSISFDSYAKRDGMSVTTNSSHTGSICCRAWYACDLMTDISLEPQFIDSISAINNDSDSLIYHNYNESNIVCSGTQGCSDVSQININSNTSSIYCLSYYSCEETEIYFNYNFYYNVSYNETLTNYNYKIESSSYNYGLNNIVYCGAYRACIDTNIYNANKVLCDGGERSCENTNIFGTNEIHITGSGWAVAKDVDIYSRDTRQDTTFENIVDYNSTTIKIYFWSYYSGNDVKIHCSAYDTCIINCLTENACVDDTKVICYGNCSLIVNCDETIGLTCPTIVNRTSTTAEPTIFPTISPTTVPTMLPTIIPSLIPTPPTKKPSMAPSTFNFNQTLNLSYSYSYAYNVSTTITTVTTITTTLTTATTKNNINISDTTSSSNIANVTTNTDSFEFTTSQIQQENNKSNDESIGILWIVFIVCISLALLIAIIIVIKRIYFDNKYKESKNGIGVTSTTDLDSNNNKKNKNNNNNNVPSIRDHGGDELGISLDPDTEINRQKNIVAFSTPIASEGFAQTGAAISTVTFADTIATHNEDKVPPPLGKYQSRTITEGRLEGMPRMPSGMHAHDLENENEIEDDDEDEDDEDDTDEDDDAQEDSLLFENNIDKHLTVRNDNTKSGINTSTGGDGGENIDDAYDDQNDEDLYQRGSVASWNSTENESIASTNGDRDKNDHDSVNVDGKLNKRLRRFKKTNGNGTMTKRTKGHFASTSGIDFVESATTSPRTTISLVKVKQSDD